MSITGNCIVCGSSFRRKPSRVGKYCSHKCYWEDKKGKPTWNKGIKGVIKQSTETIDKRRIKMIGRQVPKWVGEKISKAKIGKPRLDMRGENHHNWIEDRTKALEKVRIRHTLEWKEWRRRVFERDNWTCQECGERGCYLEAHHIIPVRKSDETLFTIKNGITLCRPCHIKTIGKEHLFEDRYSSMTA